ncbi:MAG: hypothetical protein ACI9EW_003209 [Cellvibrionaceae bacterium]|jgi:hypothetical protein
MIYLNSYSLLIIIQEGHKYPRYKQRPSDFSPLAKIDPLNNYLY